MLRWVAWSDCHISNILQSTISLYSIINIQPKSHWMKWNVTCDLCQIIERNNNLLGLQDTPQCLPNDLTSVSTYPGGIGIEMYCNVWWMSTHDSPHFLTAQLLTNLIRSNLTSCKMLWISNSSTNGCLERERKRKLGIYCPLVLYQSLYGLRHVLYNKPL